MLTHYDTLRVEATAPPEQIREQYRIRLQLVHPDRHQGASPEVIKEAERETEQLVEAFRVLSDDQRRVAYDRSLHQDRAFVGGSWADPEPERAEPGPPGAARASGRDPSYGHAAPGGGWTRYACPSCGWWQLTLPMVPEVTCERCSTTFTFVTCKSCKERVSVLATDQRYRCARCARRGLTPWASEETRRRQLRVRVRNGVALLALPILVLVIVAARVNGDGGSPDGVAYTLVGALIAVCVGLYVVSAVVHHRRSPGGG